MKTVTGFPASAMNFYANLAENNSKEWWSAHKEQYEAQVRGPLLAFLDLLAPDFGQGQLFRPNRDMRFLTAQGPYKTSQSAFVAKDEDTGYYLQINATQLQVGAGCRYFPPAQLARYRAAVNASDSGAALAKITLDLTTAGFSLTGQALKTVPRGFDPHHPRAGLLSYKTLSAFRELSFSTDRDVAEMAHLVTENWGQLRPLVDWLVSYAPA